MAVNRQSILDSVLSKLQQVKDSARTNFGNVGNTLNQNVRYVGNEMGKRYQRNSKIIIDAHQEAFNPFSRQAQASRQNFAQQANTMPNFSQPLEGLRKAVPGMSLMYNQPLAPEPVNATQRSLRIAGAVAPTVLTGGVNKATGMLLGGTGLLGGGISKLTGGDFGAGVSAGVEAVPTMQRIGMITNPLITKYATQLGGGVNNPIAKALVTRGAAGLGNIPEGMAMSSALGQGYNPLSAGIDFTAGAILGPQAPNVATKSAGNPYKQRNDALKDSIGRLEQKIRQLEQNGGSKTAINQVGKQIDGMYKQIAQNRIKAGKQGLYAGLVDGGEAATNPLFEEARKYKSAEEFVKAQGTPVFHGTASKFEVFDPKFKGYSTDASSAKGAFWFTDDPATAKAYGIYAAEDAPVQRAMKEASEIEKIAQKSGKESDWKKYDAAVRKYEDLATYDNTFKRRQELANVKEAYVKGDFLEVDAKGKTPQELSTDDNIDSWLNNKVQEAQKSGKAGLKIINIDDAVGLYGKPSTHYAVFNPEQIKTKSQLTDIWNQANAKSMVDPLMEEAKKYKSAEEFVKSRGISAFHGSDTKIDKFDLTRAGANTDSGMFGKGIYFSGSSKEASTYARKTGNVDEYILDLKNPYVINSKSDIPKIDVPNATIDDMKKAPETYSAMFTEYLQGKGYDGVIDNISKNKQYVVFDPSQIKTKSQLTDLYNQANAKSMVDPLMEEAKKYKSAEEFIKAQQQGAYYHGTPTGQMGNAEIHIGTKEASKQALEARIGIRADGKMWDGTSEYGNTLLAGKKTLQKLDPRGYNQTGFNVDVPENDFYLKDHPELVSHFGDKTKIPLTAKPDIFPVKIKGQMTNYVSNPMSDTRANATIKAMLKKGQAKRGYYYENIGEDAGSISAVVPSKTHLEKIFRESELTDIWNQAKGGEMASVPRGDLPSMGFVGAKGDIPASNKEMPDDVYEAMMREAEGYAGKQEIDTSEYADDIQRFVNIIKKKGGSAYAEHVPSKALGGNFRSSDEVASDLGISENELMAIVIKKAGSIGADKAVPKATKPLKVKYSLEDTLRTVPDTLNISKGKGIYGEVGGVSIEPTRVKMRNLKKTPAPKALTPIDQVTNMMKTATPEVRGLKNVRDAEGNIVARTFEPQQSKPRIQKEIPAKKVTVTEITNTIKKATTEGIDVPVAKPYDPNIIGGIRDRVASSVEGFFKRQGSAGQEFAERFRTARREAGFNAGRATVDLQKVLKNLTDDEVMKFADVAEGRIEANTPALKAAFDTWNKVRTEIADMSQSAGLQIKQKDSSLIPFAPRENYYPHFLPEELIKDKQAQKAALVKLVQTGWAKSIAEAESKFNQFVRRKIKRRYGNLENAREEDFPLFEKDPRKVLLSYVDSAYHRIADAKYFGSGDEKAYQLADRIALDGGDGELARRMMDRVFGKEDVGNFTKKVTGGLRAFQTVTKLGLGAVTNIGQSISTMLKTNPKVTAQAIGDALGGNKAEARQFATLTGELLESSKRELMDMAGAEGELTTRFLKKVGFSAAEEFNRIVATNAGKRHAQYLANKVLKNPNDNVSKRALGYLGLDADAIIRRRYISEQELLTAAKEVSDATQFNTSAFDLPLAWTSPWGKVLTQFKSFAYKQTMFMKNQSVLIAKEARRGNLRPLTNALIVGGIAAPLVGEVILDIKSLITNKKRDEEDGLERYLNNMFATFSMGLLGNVGSLATGKYGASGTIGELAGPSSSDAFKLAQAGQSLFTDRKTYSGMDEVKARTKPLIRESIKKIPIVGGTIANTVLENNYVNSYYGANNKGGISKKEKASGNKKFDLFGFKVDEAGAASTLPTDPKRLQELYKQDLTVMENYSKKKNEIMYSRDYADETKRQEALDKLELETTNAVDRRNEILRQSPDIERMGKLDTSKIASMPTDTEINKLKKEKAAFALVDDVFEKLKGDEVDSALADLGISRVDAEYFNLANAPTDIKSIFVREALSSAQGQKKDRTATLQVLASLRREVNGKIVLTSGVIDSLVDQEIISSDEGKLLKKVQLDKNGIPKVKVTGRGKGAKLKAIKVDMPNNISRAPEGNYSIRNIEMPSLNVPKLRVNQVASPQYKVKFNL